MSIGQMLLMGLVVLALLVPAASCETKSNDRTWDFSASRDISQIPWPQAKSKEDFLPLDINGRAVARFPDGRTFSQRLRFATFTREGNQIILITFGLEDQTIDDAYKTATELATHWGLIQPPLDEWRNKAKAQPGQFMRGGTARRGVTPTVDLEIVDSFDEAKPYAINFQIAWIEHLPGPKGKGTWDLSQSRALSQVQDAEKHAACVFNPRGMVTVRFSRDLAFHRYADWVSFHGSGDKISDVQFDIEAQTADEAHATAMELSQQFDLPPETIEQWYKQVKVGKATRLENLSGGKAFPAFLNITWGSRDKPYRIAFVVTWADATSTQPSTR